MVPRPRHWTALYPTRQTQPKRFYWAVRQAENSSPSLSAWRGDYTIVCKDAETKRYVNQLKNFSFTSETTVVQTDINGKMNEVSAALGLLQLKYVDAALIRWKGVDQVYRKGLKNIRGFVCLNSELQNSTNHSYFPVLIKDQYYTDSDALYLRLRERGIYACRYFYSLISNFSMYRNLFSANSENLPIANCVAKQVLCLPIYNELSDAEQYRIIDVIAETTLWSTFWLRMVWSIMQSRVIHLFPVVGFHDS